jgi:hypothetical protein
MFLSEKNRNMMKTNEKSNPKTKALWETFQPWIKKTGAPERNAKKNAKVMTSLPSPSLPRHPFSKARFLRHPVFDRCRNERDKNKWPNE